MKTILINGVTLTYVVERKPDITRLVVRVKEDKVYVSANNTVTIKEIEDAIEARLDSIKAKLPYTLKENTIHVRGIGYTPKFLVSDKPYVRIRGNEIVIAAQSNEAKAYHKVLYDYYEQIIKDEIQVLLPEIYRIFPEVGRITFTYKYSKRHFGMCYGGPNNQIELSTILGKNSGLDIKLTIYHEICHLYVPNHSKAFYEFFESRYPNAKAEDFASRRRVFYDCL